MEPYTVRGVATADLHLGIDNVGPLNEHGYPARVDDQFAAFDKAVGYALGRREGLGYSDEEPVDVFVIAGDLTKSRNPPQRVLEPLLYRLVALAEKGITVILVRGNHDGNSGAGQANVLDTATHIGPAGILAFNEPSQSFVTLREGKKLSVTAIPWPRVRQLVGKHAELTFEQLMTAGDEALRKALDFYVPPAHMLDCPSLTVAHLSVAGADEASEKWMTLGWDPVVSASDFPARTDLVVLGHYHKPGQLLSPSTLSEGGASLKPGPRLFYCGSPIIMDFGEAGQAKSFWTFELASEGQPGTRCRNLVEVEIPQRGFGTISIDLAVGVPPDVVTEAVVQKAAGQQLDGAVVRVKVKAATADQAAALRRQPVDTALREAGAWWVAGIEAEAPRGESRVQEGVDVAAMEPLQALRLYLRGTQGDIDRRERLLVAAGEIMEATP